MKEWTPDQLKALSFLVVLGVYAIVKWIIDWYNNRKRR